jgi:hypothetical protein
LKTICKRFLNRNCSRAGGNGRSGEGVHPASLSRQRLSMPPAVHLVHLVFPKLAFKLTILRCSIKHSFCNAKWAAREEARSCAESNLLQGAYVNCGD